MRICKHSHVSVWTTVLKFQHLKKMPIVNDTMKKKVFGLLAGFYVPFRLDTLHITNKMDHSVFIVVGCTNLYSIQLARYVNHDQRNQ